MSGGRFWLANIIGSSVWAVTILLIGVFAVENYEVILQYLNYVLLGVVVIGVGVYLWRNRKRNNQ